MFVQDRAERLGLVGYVSNDPYDRRRVEVVAEGQRPDLEALLHELESGPPGAQVSALQTAWGSAQGTFGSFRIEHDY
jgi:acylphosphatase